MLFRCQLKVKTFLHSCIAFLFWLTVLIIPVLNKPEKYISINYNYDPYLTFGGTLEPALLLNIVRVFFFYLPSVVSSPINSWERSRLTTLIPSQIFSTAQPSSSISKRSLVYPAIAVTCTSLLFIKQQLLV